MEFDDGVEVWIVLLTGVWDGHYFVCFAENQIPRNTQLTDWLVQEVKWNHIEWLDANNKPAPPISDLPLPPASIEASSPAKEKALERAPPLTPSQANNNNGE